MELDLTNIILAVIAILASYITHRLDKRKNIADVDRLKAEIEKLKTETKSDDIDNMGKSLDFYEKFVEATNKRLDEVLKNQNKLIEENTALKGQVTDMDTRMTKLTSIICTKLTCVHREVDEDVINCVYPKKEKELRKLAPKRKKV